MWNIAEVKVKIAIKEFVKKIIVINIKLANIIIKVSSLQRHTRRV